MLQGQSQFEIVTGIFDCLSLEWFLPIVGGFGFENRSSREGGSRRAAGERGRALAERQIIGSRGCALLVAEV
jgi:hypothetical protein